MKKWTVMLIPHDRGSTRTLTLSNTHLWVAVGTVAVLAFVAAFFFQRNVLVAQEAKALRALNAQLALEKAELAAKPKAEAPVVAASDEDAREVEVRLRSEYNASINALTTELQEVLKTEQELRKIMGIEARTGGKAPELVAANTASGSGKGGGESLIPVSYEVQNSELPPNIIYGMYRPSADLIKQEMELRLDSMSGLLAIVTERQDETRRMPSIWPLTNRKGRISSQFGYRRDPFNRRLRHHSGTDIAAPAGTKVMSTGRGVVKESTYDSDYGNIVKVDHGNGLETWYAHLSARTVKKGQQVERNEVIGKVGSTGRSTGPHLHYEVHKNGKAVDAANYLTSK